MTIAVGHTGLIAHKHTSFGPSCFQKNCSALTGSAMGSCTGVCGLGCGGASLCVYVYVCVRICVIVRACVRVSMYKNC